MSESCPGSRRLEAWLEGELEPAAHAELASHLAACPRCREATWRLEPTSLFARLGGQEAPRGLWEDLWPAVAEVVASEPREVVGWWRRWVPQVARLDWLAPAAASVALAVLWAGLLAGPGPVGPPVPVATEFECLTNPEAEVTHVLLSDTAEGKTIQLTMVIDASLEEALP